MDIVSFRNLKPRTSHNRIACLTNLTYSKYGFAGILKIPNDKDLFETVIARTATLSQGDRHS